MAVEWSGFGPELLLTIDRDSGVGLRAQLEDQLREASRSGRLGRDDPAAAIGHVQRGEIVWQVETMPLD